MVYPAVQTTESGTPGLFATLIERSPSHLRIFFEPLEFPQRKLQIRGSGSDNFVDHFFEPKIVFLSELPSRKRETSFGDPAFVGFSDDGKQTKKKLAVLVSETDGGDSFESVELAPVDELLEQRDQRFFSGNNLVLIFEEI